MGYFVIFYMMKKSLNKIFILKGNFIEMQSNWNVEKFIW